MAYPVSVEVVPAISGRNKLTVALRILLAIPHLILVGGIGFAAESTKGTHSVSYGGGEAGLLGIVAFILAIVSWFTIVFAGSHFPGIRDFTALYIRWRIRAAAYIMLLADRYPPFGDGDYPVTVTIADPSGPRRRLSVFFRFILALPHFIILGVLVALWWNTAIIAWFAILITGNYPSALYPFGVGVLRWYTRVEAYALLMVDEYPPFSLS